MPEVSPGASGYHLDIQHISLLCVKKTHLPRMMFRLCLITVSFLLMAGSDLKSQVVGKPFVINYDKRNYGGGNQNWSVSSGANGLTWFANDQGLLEFDGSNWTLYPMPDNGIVRSVMAGDDGNVYVGSYQEFGYWSPDAGGTMRYSSLSGRFLKTDALHNDEIWRIVKHNGKIYFQSFSNIFVYDGAQVSVLNPESSMVLLMKAGGRLFIHLVGHGLYEILDDTFRMVPGSGRFANDEIKVMLPYEGNRFLVGVSGKGFFVFDGSGFSSWDKPVNDLVATSELNNGISGNNRMVIGTIGNGLFILDDHGNLLEHLTSSNVLQNNTVLSLGFDPAGNIWVGLDRGIDLVNLHAGMDFYSDPTGNMGSVYAAVFDGTDLLVGTNQGLYRYSFVPGEGFARALPVTGLTGQVWDLRNFDGEILCGHTSGTYRISGNQATRISGINGGFMMTRLAGYDRDLLLQSTYSTFAIYSRSEGHWSLSNPVGGFYEPIGSFEIDHLGNVWCSHLTRGIFRIRLNQELDSVVASERYGDSKGFHSDYQGNVAKVENRIVFPTGRGIYTWDDLNDTIVPYDWLNERTGEFANATHIIRARENYYWFVSGNEIALFRITGYGADLAYRYDFSMQGLYLNNRYPKIISLREGLHLICLDNGFALFDETNLHMLQIPARVHIRKLDALDRDGKPLALALDTSGQVTRIPHSFSSLSFTLSAGTGYRYPLFRTRLDGLDPGWTPWSSQSNLTFTRLPAGEYRLQVLSKNIYGLNGPVLDYPFVIRPPWFGSVSAMVIYALAIAGLALLFRLLFLRRLRQHQVRIEEEEIRKRRDEMLQAEQEVIRLQNEKLEAEVNFKNTQLADFTMGLIKRNEQLIRIRDEFMKVYPVKGSHFSQAFINRMIRLFDRQITSEDDWKTFETHFDQAHQDFIKRLKSRFPDLTQGDLKLCAYLRLNISSKEIAHLLNISLRGVEVRRYRLRKRLNIKTEENLYDFLLSI
jgi:ligand-binding sensor domain-containing protein/DNA-binding CsgD family transcriptional regulator